MDSLIVTLLVSGLAFLVFLCLQIHYFKDTRKYRNAFRNFFEKSEDYSCVLFGTGNDQFPQLESVGKKGSDLNALIDEINTYLFKTKGTSDYEFVRNKVERKLNMRYDQSTVHLAFPTYLGLMGTFLGVFLGIFMFLCGFDDAGNISDNSIRNLLIGVLVSMSTSLVGLLLTTINNGLAGEARKKIEDDKNEFYDFIQTDVTKTASASLVSAISKLHDTVDTFEPAFSTVIEGFKEAFNQCTKAFGDDFKKNVDAVTSAVETMGKNMDKVNKNIELQEKLVKVIQSDELVKGLEKYVEASDHFVGITQSLNKFEEARRMMLAATQESIRIQNSYAESLKIPLNVAVKINQILDRIKTFEESVNEVGENLSKREILGNDVINLIGDQVKGIAKKGKIADKYIQMADGKLEDLFTEQTKLITKMNTNYSTALQEHIDGFEKMIKDQTEELQQRHAAFITAMEENLSIEQVRQEFTNLRKLNDIERKLNELASSSLKSSDLQNQLKDVKKELEDINTSLKKKNEGGDTERRGGFFGFGR